MRLRTLHIKGFKSFANETILNFEEDVIGVVGPNGSGKSNIVDAVRWVLGEQKSKELRLEAMSDVIFNGTKTRKESGLAQVTLTFDNTKHILPTEYQSVSVSRLLYRNGDSEYRLNNVPCRLKDIRSLFIDTGIGSNSYAIIALGMVDDILDDKDNARRRMFEQASGISKYKTRKRETLNKLKNTTADLDRIEDLLFEIEGNLKSLEKQARRTKKYFDLKEKYKDLSIKYALLSVNQLKDDYKEIQKQIADGENEYRDLDASLKILESELEAIKLNNLSKEQNLSTSQKELNEVVSTLRNLESNKSLAIQRLEFKNQETSNLNQEINSIKQKKEVFENSISSLQERIRTEGNILADLDQKVKQAKEDYDRKKAQWSSVKTSMDAYAKNKENLQKTIFDHEKSIAVTENSIENLTQEIARTEEKKTEIITSRASIDQDYQQLATQVEQKSKILAEKEQSITARKENIEKLKQKIQNDKDLLASLYRKKDSVQNEYDLLKSMVDSFEGFPASIKFLSTKWNKKAPILSDILEVEEEYKTIIEQYLENYLNHYIVNDYDEAIGAIKLLKDQNKGKASFFLMEEFDQKTSLNPEIIPDCRPAMEVLSVEERFQSILEVLLAGVYIYDGSNIENIDILTHSEKVFLGQKGAYIKAKGVVSGGSIGLFEGKKLGRKKNLDKLDKKLNLFYQDIQVLKTSIEGSNQKIKQISEDLRESDVTVLKRELEQDQKHLFTLKVKVDNYKDSINELIQKSSLLNSRKKELQEFLENRITQVTAAKDEFKNLSNGKLFSDEEINDLDFQVSESRELYNELNIQFIRHQNLTQNLQKDRNNKQHALTELNDRQNEYQVKIKQNKVEAIELSEKINEFAAQLEKKYQERDVVKTTLNEVEKQYYNARTIISEKEDAVRNKNRQLNQKQIRVNELKERFNDIKFKLTGVGERLRIEFDISINDLLKEDIEIEEEAFELQEKVEKLRYRLQNFGEINPMAVTAYDEMKERYDNIQTQREDILQAKESLLKTIKEIEHKATAKFMEAFNKVRENFIEVFRSLFTEDDTCDLILLDNENPLESNIEIVAKPKGKKPKSLSQLSGGEKTLTATALLFSLYLLKPAPFCIFDEVDAPLDDANIQKFNRIVKKFSGDSQFIIVTHNKSTMAAVDVLYGVYMQEQGVSAVTPVDFRSYEHEPVMEVVNN